MHQIGFELLQLARESDLIKWVQGKLRVFAWDGFEVGIGRLPRIVRLDKNGVLILGVEPLDVLYQPIGITPST